jgi:hypothetical protein
VCMGSGATKGDDRGATAATWCDGGRRREDDDRRNWRGCGAWHRSAARSQRRQSGFRHQRGLHPHAVPSLVLPLDGPGSALEQQPRALSTRPGARLTWSHTIPPNRCVYAERRRRPAARPASNWLVAGRVAQGTRRTVSRMYRNSGVSPLAEPDSDLERWSVHGVSMTCP